MATAGKPSLEERFRARRGGSNPHVIAMLADLVLGVVLVILTIAVWSPTTAPKAVSYGLKLLLPLAAFLFILRAFQRPAS